MNDSNTNSLHVFSRPGCHLCEQLVEKLLLQVRDRMQIHVVNIDELDDGEARYGRRIPVIEYRGQFICQYTLDKAAIAEILDGLAGS